jgi:hypothetical protein
VRWTAILLWASLGLACSQPLKAKPSRDAENAPADAAGPGDTAAIDDTATDGPADGVADRPDAFEALPDGLHGDPSPLADARDSTSELAETASLLRDGSLTDTVDVPAAETSLWADAHWMIDGACSENPPDLMQVLAASLESHEIRCTRTAVSDPEGYIDFDNDGRVRGIIGRRIPGDPNGWVMSLAGYRWPCLANQTIGYGCGL